VTPRIAITGANGFIGRHVTLAATAERREVVGVVRSEEAARAVVGAGGRGVIVNDLADERLAAAFEGATAVIHLAQIGAQRGNATYAAINVEGTRRVIVAAKQAGVARIVFFSGLGVAHYGMAPRCTNPYFLSKLAAELSLFESGLAITIFRPSYIVGPRDAWIPLVLKQMAEGELERVGDGLYRMQPIAVRDAAQLVLAATSSAAERHRVFDLVGPEPITVQGFYDRLGVAARRAGRVGDWRVREIPVAEADRAALAGGYRGMGKDELDCLLCDEVSDARPLESLLGRFLTPLDEALGHALRGA
jgi:NADH dehydrogenase